MSKHTPGPWHVMYSNQHITSAGGLSVRRIMIHGGKPGGIHHQNVAQCLNEQAEANARLIAAAPELLAALEQIKRLSLEADRSRLDVASMLGDIARAAIAKAVQS